MVLTIRKKFEFSASHVLGHLPPDHPCGRLHGHNYVVELELCAKEDELTKAGFVRDYGDLAKFKWWLDECLDHRHLNDVLDGLNPSAEHIARWIFLRWHTEFPEISAVSVAETPKTWAEFRPSVDG